MEAGAAENGFPDLTDHIPTARLPLKPDGTNSRGGFAIALGAILGGGPPFASPAKRLRRPLVAGIFGTRTRADNSSWDSIATGTSQRAGGRHFRLAGLCVIVNLNP